MISFQFTGVDGDGRRQVGSLGATSESELERLLRGRGIWLLEARPAKPESARKTARHRPSRAELSQFAALMAFQTRVGVPLVTALDGVTQDGGSRGFTQLVGELKQRVEGGASLADALEHFPTAFGQEFIQLVRAGERGGSLPEAFEQLKRHLEWQQRVAAEVKQASVYPAVVFCATALFVAVLFTFVVPKFAVLLAAVKVPLPAPTRIVLGASALIRERGPAVFGGLAALFGGLVWLRAHDGRVAMAWDRIRLRLPVVGPFVRLLVLTRFAHNLALLYRNGVVLPSALDLVGGILGSPVAAHAVRDVRSRVLRGLTLSEAMRHHPVFPPLLVRLTVIGERTGQLDDALEHVASYYHELLPQRLKRLLSLLEPALILALVSIVGLVALAVLMPVMSLMQSLR